MNRNTRRVTQRAAVCAAIALSSTALTLFLANVRFFQLLDLKARDAHFVLRGKRPTHDMVILGIDDKALNTFPEPLLFWRSYYAQAIRAAADGGAKAFVLDVAFAIPVAKYDADNDAVLAEAFNYANPKMPIVTALVASQADQQNPAFTVPVNMLASAFGAAAFANLTVDNDDFVRRQTLIEAPARGVATETLTRSMALRAAERFLGKEAELRDGQLYLGGRRIPVDADRNMVINYAGPTGTFPEVSLYDFLAAQRAGNTAQIARWVKGKIVLLGPDDIDDRHATPFYTAFSATDKWRTPGVEIWANSVQTLLSGEFLQPVPRWAEVAAPLVIAGITVAIAASVAAVQTAVWSGVLLILALLFTQLLFTSGRLMSAANLALAFAFSLIGGVIYRFATAERKSSFFKGAVALFVGKQVAQSLESSREIGLTGIRCTVTILFTDIRGFTAFCESKDPAVVVELLNAYMATMCGFIVKYHGHVNKFIGDGILAVFSDDDEGAKPGDHASRALKCAAEMVGAPGEFKTGAGLHSGEVVIGNVGSSDKMEFTVLGDTVNLASRLESLNKEHKTKLLLSHATREMAGGAMDTQYLGEVPVRGKTVPMKIYTVAV